MEFPGPLTDVVDLLCMYLRVWMCNKLSRWF